MEKQREADEAFNLAQATSSVTERLKQRRENSQVFFDLQKKRDELSRKLTIAGAGGELLSPGDLSDFLANAMQRLVFVSSELERILLEQGLTNYEKFALNQQRTVNTYTRTFIQGINDLNQQITQETANLTKKEIDSRGGLTPDEELISLIDNIQVEFTQSRLSITRALQKLLSEEESLRGQWGQLR